MESYNVKKAKELIRAYPEVFDSLLEFERTKRVPKLYRRKRLNITIDENTLKDFKSFCRQNNLNMSRILEMKMIELIKSKSASRNN
jgi:post-segregation antitoxin (ccd killing protein)